MSTELSRDRVPSSNILSVDHSIARADSGIQSDGGKLGNKHPDVRNRYR